MAGAYPSCHWAGAGGVHPRKGVPQGNWSIQPTQAQK